MSTCAVVQIADNVVINKIVASVTDPPQNGCYLIEVGEDMPCDIGWIWDGSEFVNPDGVGNGD